MPPRDRKDEPRTARGRIARRAVDVALACALVLVMATPLAEETAHEWLGLSVAVLTIAHLALNGRMLRGLLHGGPALRRAVFLLADLALAGCLAMLIASSLVLSVHAFSWLPALPGAAWARPAHMLCSFWLFALSAFHLGLHLPVRIERPAARVAAAVVVVSGVVGGIAAFAWLDLGAYLLGNVPFYAVDTSQPLAVRALMYVLAGELIAVAGAVARRAVSPRRKVRRREQRGLRAERFGSIE